ncbi:quinone oxidoreductase family protein [Protaetiibacter mangrovi]|uniref:Zinc-binding alcohol dehydrogenase family protein n=1 Tax=Protaetiibacter mangrovi TaxID=2970926 RepID=A0ABT1ZCH3_9MICO|nr:zinc-binding alcohol dehydrogenase family protein [Protaetiibacter mangrovi]MCS0498384.1 zinc-binding alcohol dehydrogenase family protein [Protaetiibacter mangrovi]TPX03401.1 zinc-binding alcohol dehydrogenase family protein [Schumannella luteola]
MHAAVVTSFGAPPAYLPHPDPAVVRPGELVVDVVAAALHPRVRSQADGSHYSSTGTLPLVPGIDAVVRDASGALRYALLDDTELGTMAERTVVEERRSVPLPANVDPVAVAAAMNPVMSSWVALRRRIRLPRRARVAVLGATGNAGRMAIQVAKRFGAREVVAVGRTPERLAAVRPLGADRVCAFDELGVAAADVDVVLDYVWGDATAAAMRAMISARADRAAQLTWVQIGSVGGLDAPLPSAAFRAARLEVVGSGIGAVPARDFARELPAIAKAVSAGDFDIRARPVPLAEVAGVWEASRGGDERIVFLP